MPEFVPGNFYNRRLQSPESRKAWETIPAFLTDHSRLLKLIAFSDKVVVHFTGSTLVGLMDVNSDIDLLIVSRNLDQNFVNAYKTEIENLFDKSPELFSREVGIDSYTDDELERLRFFDLLSHFREEIKRRLDGSFLNIELAKEALFELLEKIENIWLSNVSHENKVKQLTELRNHHLWLLFKIGVFLGSPSLYESESQIDNNMKNEIVKSIVSYSNQEVAGFFWDQFIRVLFHKLVINYEFNDPDEPWGLKRKFQGDRAMRIILDENQITEDKRQRVANSLRSSRANIHLPSFEEIGKDKPPSTEK